MLIIWVQELATESPDKYFSVCERKQIIKCQQEKGLSSSHHVHVEGWKNLKTTEDNQSSWMAGEKCNSFVLSHKLLKFKNTANNQGIPN